jgi:hypothetical protein
MRLNPVAHGNHNNLWCTARKWGITFKLCLFFDTEEAYVVKSSKKNFNPNRDYDKLYEDLKDAVDKMDFRLITPRNKYLKHNFGSTHNLLQYIKQRNEVREG